MARFTSGHAGRCAEYPACAGELLSRTRICGRLVPASAPSAGKGDFPMTLTITSYLRMLCAVVLALIGATSANAQTAQAIARKAFDSTVLLVMEDANGQPLSLGSGFFVGAGQIASNLHVVEGAVRGYAKLVGQKRKHDLEGVRAVDPHRDLVVLKIAATGSHPRGWHRQASSENGSDLAR